MAVRNLADWTTMPPTSGWMPGCNRDQALAYPCLGWRSHAIDDHIIFWHFRLTDAEDMNDGYC